MTYTEFKADQFDQNEAITLSTSLHTHIQSLLDTYTSEDITQAILDALRLLCDAAKHLQPDTAYSPESKRQIDSSSDNINSSLVDVLLSTIRAYDAYLFELTPTQLQHLRCAERILAAVYPNGKDYLLASRSGQFGAQEQIFTTIDQSPQLQQDIQHIGLAPLFELARQSHTEYGIRHGYTLKADTSPKAVWDQALERYLARVLGNHDRGTPLREALLTPYIKASDAIRARRLKAQHNKKTEPTPPAPLQ